MSFAGPSSTPPPTASDTITNSPPRTTEFPLSKVDSYVNGGLCVQDCANAASISWSVKLSCSDKPATCLCVEFNSIAGDARTCAYLNCKGSSSWRSSVSAKNAISQYCSRNGMRIYSGPISTTTLPGERTQGTIPSTNSFVEIVSTKISPTQSPSKLSTKISGQSGDATQPPIPNSTAIPKKISPTMKGWYAGSAVSGVVLLVGVALLCYWLRRRKGLERMPAENKLEDNYGTTVVVRKFSDDENGFRVLYRTQMLVDTQCKGNLVSRSIINRLKATPKLLEEEVQFEGLSGTGIVTVREKVEIQVCLTRLRSHTKKWMDIEFFVLDALVDDASVGIIVGDPDCCKHKLVTRNRLLVTHFRKKKKGEEAQRRQDERRAEQARVTEQGARIREREQEEMRRKARASEERQRREREMRNQHT